MRQPTNISKPVGLDRIIQDFQTHLKSELSWLSHAFGRAYKRTSENEVYPVSYIGKNEYLSVFPQDHNVKGLCFFDVDDSINVEPFQTVFNSWNETEIGLIFFVNIDKISTYSHRGDEEIIKAVYESLASFRPVQADWQLNEIVRGIENVYSNYNYEGTKIIDMQPYFVFSLQFDVKYKYLQDSTMCKKKINAISIENNNILMVSENNILVWK